MPAPPPDFTGGLPQKSQDSGRLQPREHQRVAIGTDRAAFEVALGVGERQCAVGRHGVGSSIRIVRGDGSGAVLGEHDAVGPVTVRKQRDRLAECRGQQRSAVLPDAMDPLEGCRGHSTASAHSHVDVRIVTRIGVGQYDKIPIGTDGARGCTHGSDHPVRHGPLPTGRIAGGDYSTHVFRVRAGDDTIRQGDGRVVPVDVSIAYLGGQINQGVVAVDRIRGGVGIGQDRYGDT